MSFQLRGPPIARIISRAFSVAEYTADIALPLSVFDDSLALRWPMILDMDNETTWQPLGKITARLVDSLTRSNPVKENPGSPDPKAEGAGSTQAAGRKRTRTRNACKAIGPESQRIAVRLGDGVGGRLDDMGRKAAPIQRHTGGDTGAENVIDYREHAALLQAWGSRLGSRQGASPNHVKRRPAKRGHREHPPRGSR